MDSWAYRREMLRTARAIEIKGDRALTNGALGLVGEAAEFSERVKKYLFQESPMDREGLLKELGDVRWYLEYLCHHLGTTMEEIEAINIAKLRERYKYRFTAKESNERQPEPEPVYATPPEFGRSWLDSMSERMAKFEAEMNAALGTAPPSLVAGPDAAPLAQEGQPFGAMRTVFERKEARKAAIAAEDGLGPCPPAPTGGAI